MFTAVEKIFYSVYCPSILFLLFALPLVQPTSPVFCMFSAAMQNVFITDIILH